MKGTIKISDGELENYYLKTTGKPLPKSGGGVVRQITGMFGGNTFSVVAVRGEVRMNDFTKAAAKAGYNIA